MLGLDELKAARVSVGTSKVTDGCYLEAMYSHYRGKASLQGANLPFQLFHCFQRYVEITSNKEVICGKLEHKSKQNLGGWQTFHIAYFLYLLIYPAVVRNVVPGL